GAHEEAQASIPGEAQGPLSPGASGGKGNNGAAACGNGVINPNEKCDDGNRDDGDGCSSKCQIEAGYTCLKKRTVCFPICGDGLLVGDEACDDGNNSDGDGCDGT